jgi:hypothetical protein
MKRGSLTLREEHQLKATENNLGVLLKVSSRTCATEVVNILKTSSNCMYILF